MSKIIVEKCMKGHEAAHADNDVAEDIEDTEDEDDLTIFVKRMKENKSNGYRRVNPIDPSVSQSGSRKNDEVRNTKHVHKKAPTKASNNEPDDDNFCHFFNNYKQCLFEENTGRKCKFSHRKAPMCDFDGQCRRPKCMYRHSKQTTNRGDFLGPRNTTFQRQTSQEWSPNPWAHQFPRGQVQNPWLWQGERNPQY